MIENILKEVAPSIVLSVVILTSLRIIYLIKNKQEFVFHRELFMLLFIIYILILFYVVSFQDVSFQNSNLQIFREMFRYDLGSKLFIKNVIGNVCLFIPYGFFVGYFLRLDKCFIVISLSFLVSLTIETTQLMIGRVFDIDDIILNIVGGIIGFYFYFTLRKCIE